MHKIFVYSQTHFPINRKKIKQTVKQTLEQQGITSIAEVTINFVGDRKMTQLHEKYLHEPGTTDVLSFPLTNLIKKKLGEIEFPYEEREEAIRLGDIVISYPQAQRQAAQHNLLVDEEINKLVEHGLLHLLGIHHDE